MIRGRSIGIRPSMRPRRGWRNRWVRPDETGRMLSSGMADEFAATLCAFGMVAEEVVHMQVHSDRARGDAEGPSVNSQGKASG